MTGCTCHRCQDQRDRQLNSEAWRAIHAASRRYRRIGPGWLNAENGDIWVSVGE